MFRHLNLIRNFSDPLIQDPDFQDFRWNIMTYSLYYGKTNIFDWLFKNFNCSLMDVLNDAGDRVDEDGVLIPMEIEKEVLGYKFTSFAVFMLMKKWRNKIGLIHLAEFYPTVFTLEDWPNCIKCIIEQADWDSLRLLNTTAFKVIFNALSVPHGT
jgi:aryl carrier-like protein